MDGSHLEQRLILLLEALDQSEPPVKSLDLVKEIKELYAIRALAGGPGHISLSWSEGPAGAAGRPKEKTRGKNP